MSLARLLVAVCNSCSCQMCPSTVPVPAQLHFSSHAPSARRLCPRCACLGLGQEWINAREGTGAMGRGRARRQLPGCPSLPALPGRGITSSKGFCQALPGAGALPGHGLSMHSWVLQERRAWALGTAGSSLSVPRWAGSTLPLVLLEGTGQ